MIRRLDGKVALVTGASRGIGRATAELLAREGASVVVNYSSSEESARRVVAKIVAGGGRAVPIQADVARRDAVDQMVSEARDRFGELDILVNNAGIFEGGSVIDMTEDQLDKVIAVNVKGIVHSVKAVVTDMLERKQGKIVNVTSIAGLATAVADTTPYALSKAAVVSLTKRLAFELGPHGINVNGIAPGFVRTDMLDSVGSTHDAARIESMCQRAVLGRLGHPREIASVVLFLASEEASFMTGQVLTVDGGRVDFLSRSS